MDEVIQFLIRHGGLVLFATVLAEQVGLPIPAVPVLLAAGALAGTGNMNLAAAIGLSVIACLLGDLVWFYLGRRRGRQVLNLLCRISLEPDSCVRHTEDFFVRHGTRSLIIAKFIPGLSTVTPAMAGLVGVSLGKFFLYNGLGAFLWTVAFIAPGYLFSDQLEYLADHAARFGGSLGIFIIGVLVLYIAYKYILRRRLLREMRIARILPEELKQMLDEGCEVVIVDLRRSADLKADPYTIPGAVRMAVEDLELRHHEIPRDRDVVLFCACPNEVTSARMALLLKKNGIHRVRPLAGGVEAWRERNFVLENLTVTV